MARGARLHSSSLGAKVGDTPVWELLALRPPTSGEVQAARPAREGLVPPRRESALDNADVLVL